MKCVSYCIQQKKPVHLAETMAAFSPDPKGQRWDVGRWVRRSRGAVVRELSMPVLNLAEEPGNLCLKLNCSKGHHWHLPKRREQCGVPGITPGLAILPITHTCAVHCYTASSEVSSRVSPGSPPATLQEPTSAPRLHPVQQSPCSEPTSHPAALWRAAGQLWGFHVWSCMELTLYLTHTSVPRKFCWRGY